MTENETLAAPELKQLHPWCTRFAAGRKAAGASLAAVGAAAGVSLQVVSQFEHGRNALSLEVFLKACAALNLRTGYVLHGEGPMFDGGRPAVSKRAGRPAART